MVNPESATVIVADVSNLWLRISLRKEDSFRLAVGQPVLFQGDGLPRVVEGKISWISPEIDEKTRTIQARVEIANPILESEDLAANDSSVKSAGTVEQFGGTSRIRTIHADGFCLSTNLGSRSSRLHVFQMRSWFQKVQSSD